MRTKPHSPCRLAAGLAGLVGFLIGLMLVVVVGVPTAGAQGAVCEVGQTYSSAFGTCIADCWLDERFDAESGKCVPVDTSAPVSTLQDRSGDGEDLVIVPADPPVNPRSAKGKVSLAEFEPIEVGLAERIQPKVSTLADFVESDSAELGNRLNPNHPCVRAGLVPEDVTTNSELLAYAYMRGSEECVTLAEFQERIEAFEEVASAEAEAVQSLYNISEEMQALQNDFALSEERLEMAHSAYRVAYVEAIEAGNRVKETRAQLASTSSQLAIERQRLESQLVESYIGDETQDLKDALIPSVAGANERDARNEYAGSVVADQTVLIERIEDLYAELSLREGEYEQNKVAAEARLDTAHRNKVELEAALAEQQQLIDEMDRQLTESDEVVSGLRAELQDRAEHIGVFETESLEVQQILAEAQGNIEVITILPDPTPTAPPLVPATPTPVPRSVPRRAPTPTPTPVPPPPPEYMAPVDPPTYGSLFGPRLHPILGVMRNHDGLDFKAGQGQHIFAVKAGTVVHSGAMGGYGNTVLIDHGNGIASLYAHQSEISVAYGQQVEQGEIIGHVGSTGVSTGPHLHFEIREGGVPVDPMNYLELD